MQLVRVRYFCSAYRQGRVPGIVQPQIGRNHRRQGKLHRLNSRIDFPFRGESLRGMPVHNSLCSPSFVMQNHNSTRCAALRHRLHDRFIYSRNKPTQCYATNMMNLSCADFIICAGVSIAVLMQKYKRGGGSVVHHSDTQYRRWRR